ncbi:MAG: DUF305 domain-containing protein [Geodermatophilaceae bacterium]|nr:DUF305 domain-containing protein [Geodermatophilaceae bacterium]
MSRSGLNSLFPSGVAGDREDCQRCNAHRPGIEDESPDPSNTTPPKQWGEPVPEDMGGMGGGSGGTGDMPGMLTDERLADLEAADGPAFDEMFLEAMIDHHTGAIQMAQTEQQDGASADAIALAEEIERAQTEEVDRLRELLADSE